jgi:ADP-heptose:LPS heptosyltransferase
MSRLVGRLIVFGHALRWLVWRKVTRRQCRQRVKRILIAHHLLLGDTLMLTPLLAKLARDYPDAERVMTCPVAIAPLYEKQPFGIHVIPFDPRKADTVRAVIRSGHYDLAFVPGDNRHAWLALAAGSHWIVAHAEDTPQWKNWAVDEMIPYPETPATWGDMVAQLAPGQAPSSFKPTDWPAPGYNPFTQPASPYAVLHVGASTPLKHWPSERWLALADWLNGQGITPVWSGGRGETGLVAAIDPEGRYLSLAGQLDLVQMWGFLARARLLVCPDTGIAHLGRVVNVPTIALFGPGSALISGAGDFWRDSVFIALTAQVSCRDQKVLFRRKREWIQRCGRTTQECANPVCMHGISQQQIRAVIERLFFT